MEELSQLPRRYPVEHYAAKAERYALMARVAYGAYIDQATRDRWGELISLARSLDSYLDSAEPDAEPARAAHIKTLLSDSDQVARIYPSLSPYELGGEGYRAMQLRAEEIIDINHPIKTAASLHTYIDLRRQEGKMFAGLISSAATAATKAQPAYARFSDFLAWNGEVCNLVNSFWGISWDYKRSEIAFKPGRASRLIIASHIARAALGKAS